MGSGNSKPELRWSYDAPCGPHAWSKHYAAASGELQSPINIDSQKVCFDEQLAKNPLKITRSKEGTVTLINTGHGFRAECHTDLTLKGGPLMDHFQFGQFHMHWGYTDTWGSEHRVDCKAYPAELHMVFWNKDHYSDLKSALTDTEECDSIVVLAVLVDIGEENEKLKSIIQNLPSIPKDGSTVNNLPAIQLDRILPEAHHEYYTYPGSLTTPPCSEIVTWIVFRHAITMSASQLAACRSMAKTESGAFEDTFRPCCPLGNRQVRSSFK